MIEFLLTFLIGLILGVLFGCYFGVMLKKPDGILIIDDSQENKTRWDLRTNYSVEEIPKKKRIIFSVNVIK